MVDSDIVKERVRQDLLQAGACAVGFAVAERVHDSCSEGFDRWVASGRHGALSYMERHRELRIDPEGLLEGVRTVVSVAWPYLPSVLRSAEAPFIARYAYCADYHKVIRKLLKPLCRRWNEAWGICSRICVDSAPVMERYWAVKSGVGFAGRNGCVIVPGAGSWVFLSEVLLSVGLEPDSPCTSGCADCGACVRVCPSGALGEDGLVDCRRCVSALTVESPGGVRGRGATLAGCDRCQEVCPHNRGVVPSGVAAFASLPQVVSLGEREILEMTDDEFRERYAGTSLSRMGREGLCANLAVLKRGSGTQ